MASDQSAVRSNSSDEMDALLDALRAQRRHVRQALSDLSVEQLRTAVPPTTWPPIAVVHHLALDVERWWFQAIVAGDPDQKRYFDEHPGGAWAVPEGLQPADVFALYDREGTISDAVIARCSPGDRPPAWPSGLGEAQSVREIVLHAIVETAAHAGQLDVVRESVDGTQWLVLE